jgi:two-component system, sensor histidine kinase
VIDWLFRAEGFAPHGMCLIWDQNVLAVHAISDAVIALSYFSIPAVLFIILRRRPDLNPHGVLHLFSLFIVACGFTHVLAIVTLWEPIYNVSSVAKALTAAVSAITAIVLWPLLPRVLATPSHQELALANQQLTETAAELTEASQARTRFLAMMSHEIRTPLAGILGFTEILRREPLEVRARTVLERIATASRSLQSLLGDILEFSRMEQDTLILHEEPIDLRALIDQIERESAGTAEAKGLTLSVDIAPDVPTRVVTDPLRVRQVLINLISNAIRYTKRGQVMVTVSKVVAQADGSGNRLEISVKDTGPGIPDHQRDVIFDAFVQADDRHFQTGRTESGAGLGLAIVRKVVDVLGGDLRLESAVGFGSEFIVTLPYRHAAATETLSPTYGEVPAEIRQKFGRILLADDVEMNRDLFADLLSGVSDEVIVVADGQQALSMLSVEAFDVAVIDVQMPVMDGLDFVRAVRMSENPKIRTLPIVGLSAAAFAEDRARALEAGMDSYVTKPASQDSLVRGLVTAMAQRAEPMEFSDRSSEAAAPSSDRAFDQTFFERQTNVLGPENVRAYLKKLTIELTARKQALHDARAIDDRAAIARLAHAIASAGGNLGFAALYRAAQAVETVTSGDGGHSQAGVSKSLELLDAALDDALARIPDLLAQQTP